MSATFPSYDPARGMPAPGYRRSLPDPIRGGADARTASQSCGKPARPHVGGGPSLVSLALPRVGPGLLPSGLRDRWMRLCHVCHALTTRRGFTVMTLPFAQKPVQTGKRETDAFATEIRSTYGGTRGTPKGFLTAAGDGKVLQRVSRIQKGTAP